MSKRNLPVAEATVHPGLRSDIRPSAFNRWHPEVRAAEDDEDSTISIFDVIGRDWFGEGVTAKRIAAALRAIGKRDVVVNVNSPGGDFFEGLAIYNLLREHPAKVTVKVVGLAASAASVIAMAGDEVRIARAGFFMIHNVWVIALGDRHELREVAAWLEPFDQTATDLYAARTGLEPDDLTKMLDRETWIGGAEAVDKGFADSLLASDDIATDAQNFADRTAHGSMREFESLLARCGVPRSKRRDMLKSLTGGKPGAAATGMQNAAVIQEVEGLLNSIRAIR